MGEVVTSEHMRVLADKEERAVADSDPAQLGEWADPVIEYAIPFDLNFDPQAQSNYRPHENMVKEAVHSVVPGAKVYTRSRRSDGRTTASVEIPDPMPVNELAQVFVAIRESFADYDVGLAKLVIEGQGSAPTAQTATTRAAEETSLDDAPGSER